MHYIISPLRALICNTTHLISSLQILQFSRLATPKKRSYLAMQKMKYKLLTTQSIVFVEYFFGPNCRTQLDEKDMLRIIEISWVIIKLSMIDYKEMLPILICGRKQVAGQVSLVLDRGSKQTGQVGLQLEVAWYTFQSPIFIQRVLDSFECYMYQSQIRAMHGKIIENYI